MGQCVQFENSVQFGERGERDDGVDGQVPLRGEEDVPLGVNPGLGREGLFGGDGFRDALLLGPGNDRINERLLFLPGH